MRSGKNKDPKDYYCMDCDIPLDSVLILYIKNAKKIMILWTIQKEEAWEHLRKHGCLAGAIDNLIVWQIEIDQVRSYKRFKSR